MRWAWDCWPVLKLIWPRTLETLKAVLLTLLRHAVISDGVFWTCWPPNSSLSTQADGHITKLWDNLFHFWPGLENSVILMKNLLSHSFHSLSSFCPTELLWMNLILFLHESPLAINLVPLSLVLLRLNIPNFSYCSSCHVKSRPLSFLISLLLHSISSVSLLKCAYIWKVFYL